MNIRNFLITSILFLVLASGAYASGNTEPIISGIPNFTIDEDSDAQDDLVDLFDFTSDNEDSAEELTFTIVEQTDPGLIFCEIDNDRYIDCGAPAADSTGMSLITIRVTDTNGAIDEDVFRIDVIATNDDPTISGIPDITVEENTGFQDNLIDLKDFASDNEDPIENLTFDITSQSNVALIDCFIDADQMIDCEAPTGNETGVNTITIRVIDSEGASGSDEFDVEVIEVDDNEAPILALPAEREVDENDGFQDNLIDLHDFASDDNDSDSELQFDLLDETNPGLIDCFIDQDRFVECNAPRSNDTGTNTLTIRVTDTSGATDTDSVRIEVVSSSSGNNAPRLSNLPDVEIEENDGFNDRLIDLWRFASDDRDSKSELDFRVRSQSNTSLIFCTIDADRYFECEPPRADRTGFSTVFIEVEDSSGLIDRESFEIEVFSEGFRSGSCRDIDVDTRTIFMDESDRERIVFDIRNRGNDDFEVTDVDIDESSIYLSVRDIDFDRFIDEGRTGELDFELKSASVTSDKEITVTIEIRGEFRNGRTCSFSDIGKESFRVRIDNRSASSSMCRDIDLRVSDVTIAENSERIRTVTIENSNSRYFTVDDVRARESNLYFSVSVEDEPSRVNSDDTETIELLIDTKSVSKDITGEIEVQVSGRFSNGTFCSLSSITEEFDVRVENRGSSTERDDDKDVSGTVSIGFSNSFIVMEKNQTRSIIVTLTNNLDDSQCFSLSTTGTTLFTATLGSNNICLDEQESESLTMNITARGTGTGNVQFKASYDGRSKSKFVSVEVLQRPTSAPIVDASIPSEISGNETIQLQNRGEDQENVRVTVVNLPEGVRVQSINVPLWRTGDILELELEVDEGFVGNIDSTIRVNSDGGSRNIPLELEVVSETSPTGFVGLATTAGLAIGLLILLVLAVVGVLSVFGKK